MYFLANITKHSTLPEIDDELFQVLIEAEDIYMANRKARRCFPDNERAGLYYNIEILDTLV